MGTDYEYWAQHPLVDRFARKTKDDYFRSEVHFLRRLAGDLLSVLDVGCASGRLVQLLDSLGCRPAFTGIDVAKENIARARLHYPDQSFAVANAVEMDLGERFDLVNATGVFQHEPRFRELLENMVRHSRQYVLFDVKLAAIEDHLVDPSHAFSQLGERRIPFVVLAFPKFFALLDSIPNVETIEVFGYETPINGETVVPEGVTPWASAGVLLRKGPAVKRVSCTLPDFIPRPGGLE